MVMEKCEQYKPKVKKLSDKLYFPKTDNKSSKWNCNSAFFENFDYEHKFDAKFKVYNNKRSGNFQSNRHELITP